MSTKRTLRPSVQFLPALLLTSSWSGLAYAAQPDRVVAAPPVVTPQPSAPVVDPAPPAAAPPAAAVPSQPSVEAPIVAPPTDETAQEPPADASAVQPEAETALEEEAVEEEAVEEEAPAEAEEFPEGFVMEDLSEDPEALAAELQAGTKQATGTVGTVSGKLIGSDGQPVIGAWVEAIGKTYAARSGVDGSYQLDLKPGTYELRLRMDGYQPIRIADVEIRAGETFSLDRTLTPLPGAVQTVEVTAAINKEGAAGRLLERQQSTASRDIMSREEMSRSGGGSTSSVAQRIVGTTIVGGRYLFVRGLGHRYGNTLMDHARMPSPDPDLRTVPLDMFPTTALSAINVQKTWTPDVPADFTGGSVQLETRDVPDRLTTAVQIGLGGNTNTTFQNAVTSDGHGAADFFGFGNKARGLPDGLPRDEKIAPGAKIPGTLTPKFTPDQIEKWGELPDTRTRVRQDKKAPPQGKLNLTIGNSWKLGKEGRIGALFAGGYSNTTQTQKEIIRFYNGDNGVLNVGAPQTDYHSNQTTNRVQLNGLGMVKLKLNKYNRLALTSVYTRDSDNTSRVHTGRTGTVDSVTVQNIRLRYIMRSIWFSQLSGSHTIAKLNKLKVDWFGSYAQGRRDDPAMRDIRYIFTDQDNTTPQLDNGAPLKTNYMSLIDHTENAAVNVTAPFKQWKQLDASFKIGGWAEGKQREFDVWRFTYNLVNDASYPLEPLTGNFINSGSIGNALPSAKGGTGPFYIQDNSNPRDNYRGSQSILAGYGLLDLPFTYWFKINGGARFEQSTIRVEDFDRYATDEQKALAASNLTRLQDVDVLPALSFVFSPNKNMNIRLTGTRTIARPELRELASFRFTDFVGGFDFIGNPNLQSTRVWNGDIRWEWFPKAGQVLALSLFGKSFDKPIESTIAASTGQGLATFRNAKTAINLGGELEFRANLGLLHKALDAFSTGGNFALVYSRVKLGKVGDCDASAANPDKADADACAAEKAFDVSSSRSRPLQGQSPFVVNVFVDWDYKKTGTGLRLLYNTFGRRIANISGYGLPDIYEESVHRLDMTASQVLYRVKPIYDDEGELTNREHVLSLSLNANNLLNAPIRRTQGEDRNITYRTTQGRSFMLNLNWGF